MFQKFLLSLLVVLIAAITITAQTQITEINERKVEFNDDGTWEYVDDEDMEEDENTYEIEQEQEKNRAKQASEKFNSRQEGLQKKRTARKSLNCSDLLRADFMDDLSGIQTVSEEVFIIGKNSFFMNWSNNKKEGLMLAIQFKSPQCISINDKISFSFRDLSENFTVLNISQNNCAGLIQINDEKAIRTLRTTKVKRVSIRTKGGISTEYLNELTAKNFLESTKCIYETTMSNYSK